MKVIIEMYNSPAFCRSACK